MGQIQNIVTPTGVLPVVRPMAERLLAEGVISGTLDGALHAADAATVKAAMMASAVCDFCSAPGATHHYDVPDFGITTDVRGGLNYSAARSTGGWTACDTCADLIRADKRKALADRAVEVMAFPKFSRRMLDELLAKFWQGMDERAIAAGCAAAAADFVEDRLPIRAAAVSPEMAQRDRRLDRILRLTGLTRVQFDAICGGQMDRDAVAKLVAFDRAYKGTRDPAELLQARAGGERKPLPTVQPHWQTALDMRFAALRTAQRLIAAGTPAHHYSPAETDLTDPAAIRRVVAEASAARDIYRDHNAADAAALRHAEAYSFNAETAAAISAAAELVPYDAPLATVDTPGNGRAGWFWFAEPLGVQTTGAAPGTNALLWYWGERDGRPELRFSVYVVTGDGIMPAAWWCWERAQTLNGLLEAMELAYDREEVLVATSEPFGRAETIVATTQLSRFFVAACLWVKSKVLVGETAHVERHARKRYVREHRLDAPPTVRVVALRASYRERAETAAAAAGEAPGGRHWTCRWVVGGLFGHPRMQPVGPGRAERKLIWIDPYVKGPQDKPLRLPGQKVYAVIR